MDKHIVIVFCFSFAFLISSLLYASFRRLRSRTGQAGGTDNGQQRREGQPAAETPPAPAANQGKQKKSWGKWMWGGLFIVAIFLTWWLTSHHDEKVLAQTVSKARTEERMVNKTITYDFYWELDRNVYIQGINHPKEEERAVEETRRDGNHLYFDQRGNETCRFRLANIGGGRWEGTFEQNERFRGKIVLREAGNGSYSGSMTFNKGPTAICYLNTQRR